MNAVIKLPENNAGKLPANYKAAVKAIAACSRIDECADWANKAEALASYARQARDDQLRKMADRIQGRAVRRCGELLKQIPPAYGANQNIQAGALPIVTRESAAVGAGLSEHQRKTALRVATIPADEFAIAIEADSPPTVTQLAEMGTVRREPSDIARIPELDTVRRFARFCGATNAAVVAASVPEAQQGEFKALIGEIDAWLDQFVTTF